MLKVLIVDDEPLARQQLEAYVGRLPELQLVGSARHPVAVQAILQTSAIDLIFLDIQMPQQNGLDFLKKTDLSQQVILITAFPEHAVEGFDLEVTDYLLKPVTFERFQRACQKAISKTEKSAGFISVKCDQRLERIPIANILYVEAMANYVHIITDQRKYTVYSGLSAIQRQLPGQFKQTHKSFLVNMERLVSVNKQAVFIGAYQVPLSRTRKAAVWEYVNTLRVSACNKSNL